MKIPEGVILVFNGNHADIPSNWARATTLDGKFPKGWGVEAVDTTGGSATHTHTSPAHSHTLPVHTHTYQTSTVNPDNSSHDGGGLIEGTHYHTGTSGNSSGGTTSSDAITYGAASNNPPFHEVIFIEAQAGAVIFDGLIGLWAGFDSVVTVPTDWLNCDGNNATPNLGGKYLRGAGTDANAGTTGGSTTNVHNIDHSHTTNAHSQANSTSGQGIMPGTPSQNGSLDSPNWIQETHTHTVSFNTATQAITAFTGDLTTSETVEPAYTKLVAIQRDGGLKPRGLIGLFLGSESSIPRGWVLCDGNNDTPNLKNRYVKVTTNTAEIGDTGGANTHTHAAQSHQHTTSAAHTHTGSVSNHSPTGGRSSDPQEKSSARQPSNHTLTTVETKAVQYDATNTTADSASNEPEYRTAIYIQFQKEIYGFVPTSL
jgi:hypothetical protein